VDVTAHRHRAVHRLNIRLFDEDLLHLDIQQKNSSYTQTQPLDTAKAELSPHLPLNTKNPNNPAGARAAARESNKARKNPRGGTS
jgi:hypothetical protein